MQITALPYHGNSKKIYSDNPCLLNLHRSMAEPASPDSRELGDSLPPDSTLANTRIHS